jgi:AcrR family transcriptional regulator
MASSTRWGDREGRRRDILDAAGGLLERLGYHGFHIRDVARDASVSPATVYTYFAGKEELFATLYAERLERFHAEIAPVCAAAETAEDLFAEIATRWLDVYRVFGRELNLWTVVLGQAADDGGELARPLVDAAGRVLATVYAAVERVFSGSGGRLADAPDAGLVMPLLWATLNGVAEQFTGERHLLHAYGAEDLARFAARALVGGIGEAAAGARPGASHAGGA